MAAGRFSVSSPKKRTVPHPKLEKSLGFGKLSRRDNGVEGGLPHEKRRKVSCDGCGRDDKEVRISTRNRVVSTNASVRLLETVGDSEWRAKIKVETDGAQGTNGSEACSREATRASLHSRKSSGQRVGMWNGFASRWESDHDEVDYEDVTPGRSDTEMSSPESGEIVGGSLGGNRRRSSGHEMEGDEYSAHGLGNGSMEIDGSSGEVSVVDQLDSDSEDYDDCMSEDPEVPKGRNINMLQGCRSAFEYEKLHKISEGTYGVVYKARNKLTGDIVALKKVKMGKNVDGFPITSLREINILMSLRHPAIVDVKEVVMDDHDGVFVVMEYMEHDLKRVMDGMKQPFSQSDVKCLMLQLLKGVKFLHDNWVLHRDLKTSNLLFNNRGELKICDFGMARQYGSPLKPYTPLVVTLWYRAPEVLLGAKQYSTAVDMWSVGCIMAELLAKEALFKGESEIQQLDKIFRVLGRPNEAIWPGFSSLPGSKAKFVEQAYNSLRKKFPAATFTGSTVLTELGFDLLSKLLTYDPEERITAEEALKHGWFDEVPLPKSKEFMPTFPVPDGRV